MFKNFGNIFNKKQKAIEDEIALKSKVDQVLSRFIQKEILKKAEVDYKVSYSLNNGVIKLNTDNKLIAQEIALRVRSLENNLKDNGVIFKKLLI